MVENFPSTSPERCSLPARPTYLPLCMTYHLSLACGRDYIFLSFSRIARCHGDDFTRYDVKFPVLFYLYLRSCISAERSYDNDVLHGFGVRNG